MVFTLAGFDQIENIRRYCFDRVNDDRSREQFIVGVDLALIRKHGIPLQELPLLCRSLLERSTGIAPIMFTERDMVSYTDEREAIAASEAAKKRRGHRPHGAGKRREPDLPLVFGKSNNGD